MRILALSDQVVDRIYTLVSQGHFAGVEMVFGCGDLPYNYLEYLVSMLNVPLFYVPGNHDPVYNPRFAAPTPKGASISTCNMLAPKDCSWPGSAAVIATGLTASISIRRGKRPPGAFARARPPSEPPSLRPCSGCVDHTFALPLASMMKMSRPTVASRPLIGSSRGRAPIPLSWAYPFRAQQSGGLGYPAWAYHHYERISL